MLINKICFSLLSGKSKKKVEKAKDFVGPKKPANAFLLFCQHRRTAVSEEYFKVGLTGEFTRHST